MAQKEQVFDTSRHEAIWIILRPLLGKRRGEAVSAQNHFRSACL